MSIADMDKLEQFHNLSLRKKEIESDLKGINQRIAFLKAELLEAIPGWAVQPPYHVGGETIYIHSTVRAKVKGDRHDAELALERAGLEQLLTKSFNLNSVSSWVREEIESGRELPAEMLEQFEIDEDFDLRMRKG